VGAPADAAAGSSAAVPLTLESLAAVVAEMSTNMAQMSRSIIALQAAWMGLTQQPPPPVSSLPPPPPPHSALPAPSIAAPAAGASPPLSSGLPLHMIQWPTSPSPIPEWALARSAVVRLQAAARGLLARRRLQEMRQPMHEATLATVDLSSAKRDLAPWDGHQQPRRPTAVFRREHGVFPARNDL
jgi:hypothetical protein